GRGGAIMRPLTVGGLLHQATVPPSSRNAAVRRWSVRRPHVHSLFMLNVGLVGFGFAGKVFHAPVIRAVAGLRLDAIVQRHGTPDPGYAGVDFVTSVDELLTRPTAGGTMATAPSGSAATPPTLTSARPGAVSAARPRSRLPVGSSSQPSARRTCTPAVSPRRVRHIAGATTRLESSGSA